MICASQLSRAALFIGALLAVPVSAAYAQSRADDRSATETSADRRSEGFNPGWLGLLGLAGLFGLKRRSEAGDRHYSGRPATSNA